MNTAIAPETLWAVVYHRSTGQEVYRLLDLPQMPATQMGRAIRAHDAVVAAAKNLLVAVDTHFPDEPFLRAEADALDKAIKRTQEIRVCQ